ncbi:MAG: hypothetical protein ACOYEV_14870 [Candidatus Nanopelagicales bacterium]
MSTSILLSCWGCGGVSKGSTSFVFRGVGLRTKDDPVILAWAANEGRILISRDIRTIPAFALERVVAGLSMPGVMILPSTVSMAAAIDDLALVAGATEAGEWASRVLYLPLR